MEDEDGNGHGEVAELEGIHIAQELHLDTASVGSSSSTEQAYYTRAAAIRRGQHQGWDEHSLPSGSSFNDSGISVRSSSPERDSPVVRNKPLNSRASKGKSKQIDQAAGKAIPVNLNSRYVTSPRILGPFDGGPDASPEAFYSMTSRPSLQHHEYSSSQYRLPSCHPTRDDCEEHNQESSGIQDEIKLRHEVLASSMSLDQCAPPKPIYRKFETLNNRALLYLQDEISGLETRLNHIDEAIAEADTIDNSKVVSHDTDDDLPRHMQWQRKELIGQILTSLDQYSKIFSLAAS